MAIVYFCTGNEPKAKQSPRCVTDGRRHLPLCPACADVDVDVDVVDLRAQADASMPASNNNVKLYNISNF